MFSGFTEGFLLGLTLGATCLITCGPVFLAFILRQERTLRGSLLIFVQILLGRLVGYALFGAAAGAIGGSIPEPIRLPITYIAFIVLSAIMIYYGIMGGHAREKCATRSFGKYISNPILLGFITGVEVCPPFVLAIARAVSLGGTLGGITLFIGFFASTSLFLIPIAFMGVASSLKGFRIAAAVLSIVVGAWFFARGASGLVLYLAQSAQPQDYLVVGVPDAKNVWIFADSQWGDTLKIMLSQKIGGNAVAVPTQKADSVAEIADTTDIAIWLDASVPNRKMAQKIGIIVPKGDITSQSLLQLSEFLHIYYFKRQFGMGFIFEYALDGASRH